MSETPSRSEARTVVRMWHDRGGDRCHAWDVDEPAFRLWKAGKGPLSSAAVTLPNGAHPQRGTQVVCGTCRSQNVVPSTMTYKIVRRGPPYDLII